MEELDVVVVGQGLAGTTLGVLLEAKSKAFRIIDNKHRHSSSYMSAGMFNPIVFKRINKTWCADEALIALNEIDAYTTQHWKQSFLEQLPIVRCFSSLSDENLWYDKKEQVAYANVLDDDQSVKLPEHISANYGYGVVRGGGRMKAKEYLIAAKTKWQQTNQYCEEVFDYEELHQLTDKRWQYKQEWIANRVVFCEGHQIKENPYFNNLPVYPNKGELLTIACEQLDVAFIINKGFFVLPLGNHHYRVGSNYVWNTDNKTPTAAFREEFETKLKKLLSVPFTIVDHQVGVRPPTRDRRPIIGEHPVYSNLFVMNGLGTKGVLLAPLMGKKLIAHWFNREPISKEINSNRFNTL